MFLLLLVLNFRFNEDCGFSSCNYREHQTHFHCMRKDCNYRFCDKTRFVQHTARHERLDTLCGSEFEGFRGVPCGRQNCELNALHARRKSIYSYYVVYTILTAIKSLKFDRLVRCSRYVPDLDFDLVSRGRTWGGQGGNFPHLLEIYLGKGEFLKIPFSLFTVAPHKKFASAHPV